MVSTAERVAAIRAEIRQKLYRPPSKTLIERPVDGITTLLVALHRHGLTLHRYGASLVVSGPVRGWRDGEPVGWTDALRRAIIRRAADLMVYAEPMEEWSYDGPGQVCRCGQWCWLGERFTVMRWRCIGCGRAA